MQTDELFCSWCGEDVEPRHWALGHRACIPCRDKIAEQERKTWCVAPMHKSNYILITDKRDLVGLNNKGGLVR